jgi:Phosphate-starvation-inducible E family
MPGAKAGKAEEGPAVARLREKIARGFAYVEDVIYVGLAAMLALSSLVFRGTTPLTLARSIAGGVLATSIIGLLDQLMLVLLIVEILYTVHVSFREHVLTAPPFLLVALIATVRRILVLTAEAKTTPLENRPDMFRETVLELALLTVMALSLVVCLYLLRTRDVGSPAVAERR